MENICQYNNLQLIKCIETVAFEYEDFPVIKLSKFMRLKRKYLC